MTSTYAFGQALKTLHIPPAGSEIPLGPLTLLVGPHQVGKTRAMLQAKVEFSHVQCLYLRAGDRGTLRVEGVVAVGGTRRPSCRRRVPVGRLLLRRRHWEAAGLPRGFNKRGDGKGASSRSGLAKRSDRRGPAQVKRPSPHHAGRLRPSSQSSDAFYVGVWKAPVGGGSGPCSIHSRECTDLRDAMGYALVLLGDHVFNGENAAVALIFRSPQGKGKDFDSVKNGLERRIVGSIWPIHCDRGPCPVRAHTTVGYEGFDVHVVSDIPAASLGEGWAAEWVEGSEAGEA